MQQARAQGALGTSRGASEQHGSAGAGRGTTWARRGARSAANTQAGACAGPVGGRAGGHPGPTGGRGARPGEWGTGAWPGRAAGQRAMHLVHSACFWPDLTQYCS